MITAVEARTELDAQVAKIESEVKELAESRKPERVAESRVSELQLLTPEYIANPEMFVATKIAADAEFDSFVEEQVSSSQSWGVNLSSVFITLGLILLGAYLWRSKQKHDQRQYKIVSMASSNVQTDPEEDMSALLERLMNDPFADVRFKDPVSQSASTGIKDVISKKMEVPTASSSVIKPVSEAVAELNKSNKIADELLTKIVIKDEKMKGIINASREVPLKGLPVKLACEMFVPSSEADVVLRRRNVKAVMLPVDSLSIAAVDGSHAIDDEYMFSQKDVKRTAATESTMQTLQNRKIKKAIIDKPRMPVKKPQSMAELSEFLNKESDGEAMNDMVLADSYFNIGIMFANGDGIAPNLKLGSRWLQKAADKGHGLAKVELEIIQSYDNAPEYLGSSLATG